MIREHNLKLIFLTIADNPRITRAELAKKTRLTKTTVSSLVDELLAGYFINENDFEGNCAGPGRRPLSVLELDGSRSCVLVISWEKKRLVFTLAAMNSAVLMNREAEISDHGRAASLMERIYGERVLPASRDAGYRILSVCVVFPGIVDSEKGKLHSTVLGILDDGDVYTDLKNRFPGLPLAFFNDTASLGYAESKLTELNEKDFAFINLNEGVGAVLFAQGGMHRGAGAVACQFGHLSLDRNGPECRCGNRGCADILLGEIGLASRGVEAGYSRADAPGNYRRLRGDLESGDARAVLLAESLAEDLAYGLGILVSLANPRIIVIGGRGAAMGEEFLSSVKGKLKARGFMRFTEDVDVHYTRLSGAAVPRGAARYFMDTHYSFTNPMDDALFLG